MRKLFQLRETPGPGGQGLPRRGVGGSRVPQTGRGSEEDPQGGPKGRCRGGGTLPDAREPDVDAGDRKNRLYIARKRLVPYFCWNMEPIETFKMCTATLLFIMLCIIKGFYWQKTCFPTMQILKQ
uniref:Uncharacterized protein n=1 Tax=Aotus nancymaae TaxID=37293 RepID=A0A2K5EJK8_AOTNA